MPDIAGVLADLEAEARRAEFPVDREAYAEAGRDPLVPIAFAGSLDALVCSLGRDLGRDEVRHAQPQVGAAGRLVRSGVLTAVGRRPAPDDPYLEAALEYIFLSNTVPYKPPGNKAYSQAVRRRFQPSVARLLTCCWTGRVVITLGTEAFQWFESYAEPGAAAAYWRREDRYEAEFSCRLTAPAPDGPVEKPVIVCPLPHPSPLNQRWVARFPGLLQQRLRRWLSS